MVHQVLASFFVSMAGPHVRRGDFVPAFHSLCGALVVHDSYSRAHSDPLEWGKQYYYVRSVAEAHTSFPRDRVDYRVILWIVVVVVVGAVVQSLGDADDVPLGLERSVAASGLVGVGVVGE